MPQIGASQGITSQATSTIDGQGNPIISSDTSFGGSPAGSAILTQQLFGLANATFNLTPPNIYENIGPGNDVPYWAFAEYSDGIMTAVADYDPTTQTWGIVLSPGTAASGDYCTFTTRSYLVNDSNLDLRQRALSVISKSGTAGGTASQWNMTLSAIYYDSTDTALSTAVIGTALDTDTWTSFSGTTTPGGSAIGASARYVDLQYKVTATAAVTGTAKATIKSTLLQSSARSAQSFLVKQTFTSSTTWSVPTGVTNLVAVAVVGAGGGGAGGCIATRGTIAQCRVSGGGGGGSGGGYSLTTAVDLGTATTISIGIGAGGAGGSGTVFTKAANGSGVAQLLGANGAAGGATTFGFGGSTFITHTGGGGGTAGTASNVGSACAAGAGGTQGGYSSNFFTTSSGAMSADGGGRGGSCSTVETFSEAGVVGGKGLTALVYSYVSNITGTNGGTATTAGGSVTFTVAGAGTVGTVSASLSGGGGGASSIAGSSGPVAGGGIGGTAAGAASAGGGAGESVRARITDSAGGTITIVAGSGGSATNGGGGGGGAGGGIIIGAGGNVAYNDRPLNATTGTGGRGGDGLVTIVYIG